MNENYNLLFLEKFSIGFNGPLIKNINASISPGTITVLMGVNGVGKSCFLKTLGGLIPSMGGSMKFLKKDFTSYSPIERARLIAMVLTDKIHIEYLKVQDLVLLGRSPYTNWAGNYSKEDRDLAFSVMNEVGIVDLKNQYFLNLSDGQKQRVLIARALAQNPHFLILDEPTTYLDIPSKIKLINLLKLISRDHQNKKISILMSSHDLELIEPIADQIWLIGDDGSFTIGTPQFFRSQGLFDKHFYYQK